MESRDGGLQTRVADGRDKHSKQAGEAGPNYRPVTTAPLHEMRSSNLVIIQIRWLMVSCVLKMLLLMLRLRRRVHG